MKKSTQILIAGLFISFSFAANAETKCSHQNGKGLFASTHPEKKVSTKSSESTSCHKTKKGRK